MVKVQTNSQGKVYLSNGNALLAGASSAVISTLSVTPTTSAQTITAPSGVDGYSPVEVSAVTSSIDANITAGNIKDGVTILGVTGDYTGGGSSTKYGASIDNFLGNTVNGVLGLPVGVNGLDFTGVTELANDALSQRFMNTNSSGTILFPNLVTINNSSLYKTFSDNQITSVNLSALTTVGYSGLDHAFSDNQITGALDLSSLTTVLEDGMNYAFSNNQITSVDLSSLTTVGMSTFNSAFVNNQIASVDLSSLTTVSAEGMTHTFANNQITSINLSSLTTVDYSGMSYAFSTNQIASVNLSSLTTINSEGMMYAFEHNQLVNVVFDSLTRIYGSGLSYTFSYQENPNDSSTTLQSISFPALINNSFTQGDDTAFDNMLWGNTGVTVHFPSNLQSVIGSWQSVIDGFGGTNTTVLFDLPSTMPPTIPDDDDDLNWD